MKTSASCPVNYPSVEGSECPFHSYDYLRSEAPVYRMPDRPDVFIVSRHQDVAQVAKNPEIFISAGSRSGLNPFDNLGIARKGGTTLTMGESDPPDHKPRRDLWFALMKPVRMRERVPRLEQLVDELIDEFIDEPKIDFVDRFANPLPVRVTRDMLGLPEEDDPRIFGWGQLEPPPGLSWLSEERQQAQQVSATSLASYLREQILDRHENPRDDELSETIQRHVAENDGLDIDYMVANTALILAGGVATTAHLMASAMMLLLQNPGQMAKVRADHGKIPRMLEEALRLETPAQWVPRKVKTDTEIDGVTIPAGSFVLLMWASANRDGDRFENPEQFDVDRKNVMEHVGFGAGPHFCLGSPLARNEARIAFERLFSRLGEIRLAEGNDFTHYESPAIRGLKRLEIEIEPA